MFNSGTNLFFFQLFSEVVCLPSLQKLLLFKFIQTIKAFFSSYPVLESLGKYNVSFQHFYRTGSVCKMKIREWKQIFVFPGFTPCSIALNVLFFLPFLHSLCHYFFTLFLFLTPKYLCPSFFHTVHLSSFLFQSFLPLFMSYILSFLVPFLFSVLH